MMDLIEDFECSDHEVKRINKRPWVASEDANIVRLVQKYGVNWVNVSEHVPGRTGKQCRERYYNHLQLNIKKGDWSVEEDLIILRLQAKYGNQWVKIMKELPGRTDNAVKNRFHALGRAHITLNSEVFANLTGVLDSENGCRSGNVSGAKRNRQESMGDQYKKTYFAPNKRSLTVNLANGGDYESPHNLPLTPTSVATLITPNNVRNGVSDNSKSHFNWKNTTVSGPVKNSCESVLAFAPSDLFVLTGSSEEDTAEMFDVQCIPDCLSPLVCTTATPLSSHNDSGNAVEAPMLMQPTPTADDYYQMFDVLGTDDLADGLDVACLDDISSGACGIAAMEPKRVSECVTVDVNSSVNCIQPSNSALPPLVIDVQCNAPALDGAFNDDCELLCCGSLSYPIIMSTPNDNEYLQVMFGADTGSVNMRRDHHRFVLEDEVDEKMQQQCSRPILSAAEASLVSCEGVSRQDQCLRVWA